MGLTREQKIAQAEAALAAAFDELMPGTVKDEFVSLKRMGGKWKLIIGFRESEKLERQFFSSPKRDLLEAIADGPKNLELAGKEKRGEDWRAGLTGPDPIMHDPKEFYNK